MINNKLNMKEIIKNNVVWLAFVIGMIMIFVGYYYNKHESLIVIGGCLWLSSRTIDMELNKKKLKIWYVYLITLVFFVFNLFFFKIKY